MALAVPVRLTSIVICQSGSSISRSGWKLWMPAFANKMSMPPNSCPPRTAATRNAGRSRWSSFMPSQRRAAPRTSCPVSSRSSGVDGSTPERGSTGAQISRPMMSAPSRAKAMAVARPIPRAAPVTTATLLRRGPAPNALCVTTDPPVLKRSAGISPARTESAEAADSKPCHRRLLRRDLRQGRLVDIEVRLHKLVWCKRQPLHQRDAGKVIGLPQLEVTQLRRPRVLDIVGHALRHIAGVAALIVEGLRIAIGSIHRHPALALDVVLQLIRIRVPVQFAHPARLDLDQPGGDHWAAGKFEASTMRTVP